MKRKNHWKDLLYFSSTERRALSLLLGLLVALCILLAIAPPKGGKLESTTASVSPLLPQRPPKYPRQEKFAPGTKVELNAADTSTLKKVPGIGSSYARRIVGYRRLLGGFYAVSQLRELYGMDEERFLSLKDWFYVETSLLRPLAVNRLTADSLAKHPYLSYRQSKAIYRLRKQKGRLEGWNNLILLDEFTEIDRQRLAAYLSFR
ncbi:MAG: helix-hairpin-helix domain-containing protein [Tannerella sp.]|jgi:DNA uptake protein ComE-like DNA-binding protein|nr:helix-hairpin-helix domain-containing protein [Tannerella sp.]